METTAPSARQMSDGTLWCVPIHSSAYGDAGSTTNAGLPDAANCRRERECSVSVMLCQSAHDGMWVRVVRMQCVASRMKNPNCCSRRIFKQNRIQSNMMGKPT